MFLFSVQQTDNASLKSGLAQTKIWCCQTEVKIVDQTCYLIQSHYADTGPATSSTDPTVLGVLQGNYQSI